MLAAAHRNDSLNGDPRPRSPGLPIVGPHALKQSDRHGAALLADAAHPVMHHPRLRHIHDLPPRPPRPPTPFYLFVEHIERLFQKPDLLQDTLAGHQAGAGHKVYLGLCIEVFAPVLPEQVGTPIAKAPEAAVAEKLPPGRRKESPIGLKRSIGIE